MDMNLGEITMVLFLVFGIIIFITSKWVDYEQNKDVDEYIELIKNDYELYIYDMYKDISSYEREDLKDMLLEYRKDRNNKIKIYDADKEIRILYEPIVIDSVEEKIFDFLF